MKGKIFYIIDVTVSLLFNIIKYIFKTFLQIFYFIKNDVIYFTISFTMFFYKKYFHIYYLLKYLVVKSRLYSIIYTKRLRKKISNNELWKQQENLIDSVISIRKYLTYLLYKIYSTNIYSVELKIIIKNIIKNIKKQNINLIKECDNIIKLFEETTLNIVFFGETRAGKSTLIEILNRYFAKTNEKIGLSIGNGMSDFTKSSIQYSIKINDVNLNLIDMPGIEGNEQKYENMIKDSLNKAHIVFYIQGSDKNIERSTVEKIKQYLNKNSNIYSIMNLHLQPKSNKIEGIDSTYIEEMNKQKNSMQSVENDIKNIFENYFGEQYRKHIHTNILQAFFSITYENNETLIDKSRNDLIELQKKYMDEFSSIQEMFDTSGIQNILTEISSISQNYIFNITSSNRHKIQYIIKDIYDKLKKDKNVITEELDAIEKKFITMNAKIDNAKQNLDNKLNNIGSIITDEAIENTIMKMNKYLDKFETVDDIIGSNEETDIINKILNRKLNKIFNKNISNSFKKHIKQDIDIYNKQIGSARKALTNNSFLHLYESPKYTTNIFKISKTGIIDFIFTLFKEDTSINKLKVEITNKLYELKNSLNLEINNAIRNNIYLKRINKNYYKRLAKQENDMELLQNNTYINFIKDTMNNIDNLYDDTYNKQKVL